MGKDSTDKDDKSLINTNAIIAVADGDLKNIIEGIYDWHSTTEKSEKEKDESKRREFLKKIDEYYNKLESSQNQSSIIIPQAQDLSEDLKSKNYYHNNEKEPKKIENTKSHKALSYNIPGSRSDSTISMIHHNDPGKKDEIFISSEMIEKLKEQTEGKEDPIVIAIERIDNTGKRIKDAKDYLIFRGGELIVEASVDEDGKPKGISRIQGLENIVNDHALNKDHYIKNMIVKGDDLGIEVSSQVPAPAAGSPEEISISSTPTPEVVEVSTQSTQVSSPTPVASGESLSSALSESISPTSSLIKTSTPKPKLPEIVTQPTNVSSPASAVLTPTPKAPEITQTTTPPSGLSKETKAQDVVSISNSKSVVSNQSTVINFKVKRVEQYFFINANNKTLVVGIEDLNKINPQNKTLKSLKKALLNLKEKESTKFSSDLESLKGLKFRAITSENREVKSKSLPAIKGPEATKNLNLNTISTEDGQRGLNIEHQNTSLGMIAGIPSQISDQKTSQAKENNNESQTKASTENNISIQPEILVNSNSAFASRNKNESNTTDVLLYENLLYKNGTNPKAIDEEQEERIVEAHENKNLNFSQDRSTSEELERVTRESTKESEEFLPNVEEDLSLDLNSKENTFLYILQEFNSDLKNILPSENNINSIAPTENQTKENSRTPSINAINEKITKPKNHQQESLKLKNTQGSRTLTKEGLSLNNTKTKDNIYGRYRRTPAKQTIPSKSKERLFKDQVKEIDKLNENENKTKKVNPASTNQGNNTKESRNSSRNKFRGQSRSI